MDAEKLAGLLIDAARQRATLASTQTEPVLEAIQLALASAFADMATYVLQASGWTDEMIIDAAQRLYKANP